MFSRIKRQRGFTLVEMMVVITILLIVVAIVFEVYVKAVQYNAYFAAKDDMLTSMNMFASQVNKYTDGAGAIYTIVGSEPIPMINWSDSETLDNVAFCTMRLDSDGSDVTDIVYIYNEPVKVDGKQLYFADKTDGDKCKPLMRIVVKIENIPEENCKNADSYIREAIENNWAGAKVLVFKPTLVDARNSFSYMYFYYTKYYINPSTSETITWPSLTMRSVFGVLRNIYDDSGCTHRVTGYAVDVYPYEQTFNIYGRNIEKER